MAHVEALGYDTAVIGQMLVSIAFSLWRAAFLADRSPDSGAKHAIEFLEKLILDNAINYSQDRNARDWTWAYYVSNAIYHLRELEEVWDDFKYEETESEDSCERWTHMQMQLSNVVDRFEKDLLSTSAVSK